MPGGAGARSRAGSATSCSGCGTSPGPRCCCCRSRSTSWRWCWRCRGRCSRRRPTDGSAARGAVGWLYSAIAIGSVLAGLTSGWIGRVRRQGVALIVAVVGWGLAVAAAGWRASAVAGGACCSPWPARPTWSARSTGRRCCRRTRRTSCAAGMQGVFTAVVAGGPRLGDLRAGAMAAAFGTTVAWVGGGIAARGRRCCSRSSFPALRATADRDAASRVHAGARSRLRSRGMRASRSAAPSGAQWEIPSGDQRAVIVEVGGGLRSYTVGGDDVVDGYEPRTSSAPAGPVRCWRRGRTGSATGGTRSAAQSLQLSLTEPARHNAIHGLVSWVRWHGRRTSPRRGDGRVRPARPARLPVAAAPAHHLVASARTACAPTTRRPTSAASRARSASACTRTCSFPGVAGRRSAAHAAGPQPAAGRRPAAADRRGEGGRRPSSTSPSPRRLGEPARHRVRRRGPRRRRRLDGGAGRRRRHARA